MTRLAYAAEQLRDQVRVEFRNAKVGVGGKPDGFGVYRSLVFGKGVSKHLVEVLEIINDNRIESLRMEEGILTVTFVTDARTADDRREYPLAAVVAVLRG